jgi:rRNA maturation protein Nop10
MVPGESVKGIRMSYYTDYDTVPIGGSNPYYQCCHCGVSVPAINGRLDKHDKYCSYRIKKQNEGFKDENSFH